MSVTAPDVATAAAEARSNLTAADGCSLPILDLDTRRQRVLDDLLAGAFAPLQGYLGRADYNRVIEERRLADGSPCELPVTLDVSEAFSASIYPGSDVLLRAEDGTPCAVLHVKDIYWPDHLHEARRIHGTSDRAHPRVAELFDDTGPVYLGGSVRRIAPPSH